MYNRLPRPTKGGIKKISDRQHLVATIALHEDKMRTLSDEALQEKTREFQARYQKGETLDALLPEAFAVIKEANFRVLGMRPYDVQVLGAIALHQGAIAEMKTGEGKTLVATMPAYLNALTGEGVHVITVNDYLAQRDAEEMGAVHTFMGLRVGCVISDMSPEERKAAYQCDITYLTNNELGFDYLRDNMATRKENVVQRGLTYAIIDEVDSILIDEARTPLIISGSEKNDTILIEQANFFAQSLERHETLKEFSKIQALTGIEEEEIGDYTVNRKDKSVSLTARGQQKAERFFRIPNLSDPQYAKIAHAIGAALRAHGIMKKDQDYVVRKDEILIVDEFTGRIMSGRRYSDGLHQAIEAKEKVTVNPESQTLATITYQNLFNKYNKKAGMTGTGYSEEKEFKETYQMEVIPIPTNRPVKRIDKKDVVYPTKAAKYDAVIHDVIECFKEGQPVLIGTINIDDSERLSQRLKEKGIPHNVLNAKNDAKEADIVERAGQFRQITIATNMAGRGTDIKLDRRAKMIGGLKVIGTERHESRRIDDQLRGRSGRQGDPGESVFYLSLEDELMKLFGSPRQIATLRRASAPDAPIRHGILTRSIERAQRRIEWDNYAIRKSLLEYDEVNNEQREIIYKERNKVLNGESMKEQIEGMTERVISRLVEKEVPGLLLTPARVAKVNETLRKILPIPPFSFEDGIGITKKSLIDHLVTSAKEYYKEREATYQKEERLREVERQVLLRIIDKNWKTHLDDMEALKQWVGIKSYAQKDPKLEYKRIGYDLFQKVSEKIQRETVHTLYTMPIYLPVQKKKAPRVIHDAQDGAVGMKISVK